MGTTLTGTTPQDTYDSLIKVTDNGPLSGTAKLLTDGLGNDSALALSTTAVGVRTTSPLAPLQVGNTTINNAAIGSSLVRLLSRSTANDVQEIGLGGEGSNTMSAIGNIVTDGGSFAKGAIYFATRDVTTNTAPTERMRITSAGNVGIGTNSPNYSLQVNSATTTTRLQITNTTTGTGASAGLQIIQDGVNTTLSQKSNGFMSFETNNTERFRITANGVTFNGDTAAANALDDYEEGTWTMGLSFGGGTTGITYANNTGTYTKVGRKVTVNGYIGLSSKGSSTGAAVITGLPFTIPNVLANYAAASVYLDKVTFANQYQAIGNINTTNVGFSEITEAGAGSALNDANFANNSEIIVNFTYFV